MADAGGAEVVGVRMRLVDGTDQEHAGDGGTSASTAATSGGRGSGEGGQELPAALGLQGPHLALGGGLVGVQLVHHPLGRGELGVQVLLLQGQLDLLGLQAVLLLLQGGLVVLQEGPLIGDLGDQVGVGAGHVVHDLQAVGEVGE